MSLKSSMSVYQEDSKGCCMVATANDVRVDVVCLTPICFPGEI